MFNEEFVQAVAKRWWDQDPEGWKEDGHDRSDDLRKDVRQVLNCAQQELVDRLMT